LKRLFFFEDNQWQRAENRKRWDPSKRLWRQQHQNASNEGEGRKCGVYFRHGQWQHMIGRNTLPMAAKYINLKMVPKGGRHAVNVMRFIWSLGQ
jgi:hypothetical protein